MTEIDEKALEAAARAICEEVNPVPFDDLPEATTYLERKTHIDRPLLDKQEARETARAAISAYEAAKGDGWLPIESAPKDGSRVLIADESRKIYEAIWLESDGEWWWLNGDPLDRYGLFLDATHWQPLPAPPVGSGGRLADATPNPSPPEPSP